MVIGMHTLLEVAPVVVALYVNAGQLVHTRLTVADGTGVGAMYVPRPQLAHGAHTLALVALVNVPAGQAVHTRFCDAEPCTLA